MRAAILLPIILLSPAEPPVDAVTEGRDAVAPERRVSYAVADLPAGVTVRVPTGLVLPDESRQYRDALQTQGVEGATTTTVVFVEENPALEVIAAVPVLARHNTARVALVHRHFRGRASLDPDIRNLTVSFVRLAVIEIKERDESGGSGILLKVRPSYGVVTAAPTLQGGYGSADKDEAEVWLINDGKLTLLDGDVKLGPFLFP